MMIHLVIHGLAHLLNVFRISSHDVKLVLRYQVVGCLVVLRRHLCIYKPTVARHRELVQGIVTDLRHGAGILWHVVAATAPCFAWTVQGGHALAR